MNNLSIDLEFDAHHSFQLFILSWLHPQWLTASACSTGLLQQFAQEPLSLVPSCYRVMLICFLV